MRYFRLLVIGNALSAYGSYLNMVALNLFAYTLTGSALYMGAFMAVRLCASVAGGVLAGWCVSRFSRKPLMIGAEVTQAASLLVFVVAPAGARGGLLFALAVVTGLCATMAQVAIRTAIPDIVDESRRTEANALLITGRSLAMVAGFGSASVVVTAVGYTGAFLLDAATFAVAALNLLWLPIRSKARPAEGGDSASGRSGWLLRGIPAVLTMMVVLRGIDGLGSSSHNAALPVFSSELDPADPATFMSQFLMTWAIGNIIIQQLVGWHSRRTGRSPGEWTFAVGTCVMSAAFIAAFTGLATIPLILVALVAGMADGITETAYTSRIQLAPDHLRGTLFGRTASAENLGFGLGIMLSGALLEVWRPFGVVGLLHGLAIVLGLGFVGMIALRGRRGAAQAADPDAASGVRAGEVGR